MRTLLCTQHFRRDAQHLQQVGWPSVTLREAVESLRAGHRLRPHFQDRPFVGTDEALRQCDVGGRVVLLYRATLDEVVLVRLLIPTRPLERITYTQAQGPIMVAHYIRLALRQVRRQKGYAALNIIGLALGLACSLLLFLFIRNEFSYDRFHEHADRIYRITTEVHQITPNKARFHFSGAATLLAPTLQEVYHEVEAAVRIKPWKDRLVAHEERRFYETGWVYADASLFEVFSFTLGQGDPTTALIDPYTVVITEAIARKYFGEANPIGKTLHFDEHNAYRVTGVLAPIPSNSHLQFDFIASYSSLLASLGQQYLSWRRSDTYTYVRLDDQANPEAFATKLEAFPEQYMEVTGRFERNVYLRIQPLTEVYLHWEGGRSGQITGDIRYLYLFGGIALLVLLIACINYINLATARAIKRAREVGIRKATGASRGLLVRQFLVEAVVVVILAAGVALFVVGASLPAFNTLVQKDLVFEPWADGTLVLGILMLVLGVSLVAGGYPAFLLGRFRPVLVLKGAYTPGKKHTAWLRRGLVVFQFALSVALIVCTLTVQNQLDYIQNQRLGFEADQAVVIPVRKTELPYPAFKQALLQQPAVKHVTTSSNLPARSGSFNMYAAESFQDAVTSEPMLAFEDFVVDEDFLETLGITLREGRNLNPSFVADSMSAILINETAVAMLGWTDPVGRHFPQGQVVVGIVEDFYFRSRRFQNQGLTMRLTQRVADYVVVKLAATDLAATLALLERTWKRFAPEHPFEYSFMDDDFESLYQAEQRLGRTFGTFTLLSVLIACLGLFGLATYAAEQRAREVGIRKVLGASTQHVVRLMTQDVIVLLVIALIIGMPIAYWGIETWLADFAYRVTIGSQIFLFAGCLTLGIAVLAVGGQAFRAAHVNPIDVLKHE